MSYFFLYGIFKDSSSRIIIIKEKLGFNDDDDDRVYEDRRACQSRWSKRVRPQQGSKDSSY